MPNAIARANARALPSLNPAAHALRRRLADAAQRIIDALDALDAPDEDLEDEGEAEDGGDLEPSLSATGDVDQRIAWTADRASWVIDGEASGAEDDVAAFNSTAAHQADQQAKKDVRSRLRVIVEHRRGHTVLRGRSR